MEKHDVQVQRLCTHIRHFYDQSIPFRIYHGSTNSTRHAGFGADTVIDVSSLNHVLSINPQTKRVLVEPNVPMDLLVRETIISGLLPPVVMEFPGITVGGGFVGTAGESSSWKHGFFDRTIVSAEVILADGTLTTASEHYNKELFDGLRGSFGTLGVLTLLEIQLIPLRSMVEVSYHPTFGLENAVGKMQYQVTREENDYVDGVLFSKESGVIVTGRLVDGSARRSLPLRRFSRPWDEWFWIHARSMARKGIINKEVVPIEDYLFRYDRGAFWMGIYAYQQFMVPFLWITRLLLDYFMHTRIMYHALHASGYTDRFIIHDIAVPSANATPFLTYFDDEFKIYPLWLCPLRNDARSSMGFPKPFSGRVGTTTSGHAYDGSYISVGIWGPGPSSDSEYVTKNRQIEAKMRELGGLKWLYSRVFYTDNEWWDIYDRDGYEEVRKRFNATSLPTIQDKVADKKRRDHYHKGLKGFLKSIVSKSTFLSGLYGVYKALRGGDYILARKKD